MFDTKGRGSQRTGESSGFDQWQTQALENTTQPERREPSWSFVSACCSAAINSDASGEDGVADACRCTAEWRSSHTRTHCEEEFAEAVLWAPLE